MLVHDLDAFTQLIAGLLMSLCVYMIRTFIFRLSIEFFDPSSGNTRIHQRYSVQTTMPSPPILDGKYETKDSKTPFATVWVSFANIYHPFDYICLHINTEIDQDLKCGNHITILGRLHHRRIITARLIKPSKILFQ